MKLLIIDDHGLVREAARHVLAAVEHVSAVLTASDCDSGFAMAAGVDDLDLVLLDLNLPGLSGLPALQAWRINYPSIPVIVVSGESDIHMVRATMANGAAGFVPKTSSNEILLAAVNLVLAGGKYFPSDVLAGSIRDDNRFSSAQAGFSRNLTPRHLEILRLLQKGQPNKVISRELGVAERTVKAHLTEIYRALNVTSRTQAALAAIRLGLTEETRLPSAGKAGKRR